MVFNIEMTFRGVLLAGKWRTEEELNRMLTDDKRNAVIVAMLDHSNITDVAYFQRLNDDDLIGRAAVVVFMLEAGIRSVEVMKTYNCDDHVNTLIVENNDHTDIPVSTLQGYDRKKLVQIGLEWYAKSKTIAAILEMEWHVNVAKVLQAIPDNIATQTFDNRQASEPLNSTFTFEKEVENKSTFSHTHGFDVHIGVETSFKAGIPFVAEGEVAVKFDATTSHTWSFGEENVTRQKYAHSTEVSVPPGKHIQYVAQITSARMEVPYRAKIRTESGLEKWIEGTWNGVSTTNLIVTQTDLPL